MESYAATDPRDSKPRTLRMISAANGMPTALFTMPDGRELFLHSRFDPSTEARFLIQKIPIRERTQYVILGFGLGYHVKELLARIPSNSHILVLEPQTEHLGACTMGYYKDRGEQWVEDARLICLSHPDPDAVPMFLADSFTRNRALSLHIYTHIPSAATNESFYRALQKIIPLKFPEYFDGHLGVIDRMLENNLVNFWANLDRTWHSPHISSLVGKWQNNPCVIVAAGPSLNLELEHLRRIQGNVPIVCVGTAARILVQNNILPDLIVSLDPFKANMRHFQGWDTRRIPLLYYHRMWRGLLSGYRGPTFWFTMDDEPAVPLTNIPRSTEFWRGGTVSFSALQVAHYLKADPIILVGLDFAFYDGQTHAQGAATGETLDASSLPDGIFRIPGVAGNPVMTNPVYYSYLMYIQDFIKRHPKIRHINTSRTGAKIEGTEEMGLGDLLQKYRSKPPVPPSQIIQQCHDAFKPVQKDRISKTVRRWEREISLFLREHTDRPQPKILISAFKRLTVCKELAPAYNDCFYRWEVMQIRNPSASSAQICSRFIAHCREVQSQFRRILSEL